MTDLSKGYASSAQVHWVLAGGATMWKWSASGPGGMSSGTAASKEEAWSRAREAQRMLDRPVRPAGMG